MGSKKSSRGSTTSATATGSKRSSFEDLESAATSASLPRVELSHTAEGGVTRRNVSRSASVAGNPAAAATAAAQTNGSATDSPNTNVNATTASSPETDVSISGQVKQLPNAWVRTITTLMMIGGYFLMVALGPVTLIMMVSILQTLVFREVISLSSMPNKLRRLPWQRALNWYFLLVTNYFLYGESILFYFRERVFRDAFTQVVATNHRFISFGLYIIGFVWFVLTLRKGHYQFQISQFATTHMALMFVVIQSHFIINNIFEGIIWVFLPIALVVTNDIFAYIFGKLFGRTPLIQLSPKKTWEGFLGAWISTVIIGIFFAGVMRHYPYFLCPIKDVSVNAWSGVTCDPNTVFEPIENDHIPWIMGLIRRITGEVTPLQLHTIVLATFASLVAPFGGFFASGVKRAFNLKDFGDSIPGHGGLTDRMDCQFIMGLFSHIYIRTFVSIETAVTVGSLLQLAIQNLSLDDQLALYHDLGNHLSDQGTIAASVQHSQLLEAGIVP